ncbi:serine/threonine-protein kinase [Mucisphaera sp.]|uniref:serine/threonine-protein kinase n=1 Tax=Mucisphaera sp. TaxID=2913024 RepID=UPI003D0EB196
MAEVSGTSGAGGRGGGRPGGDEASELTAAVYAYLLERRLAGEPVTREAAVAHVAETRELVLAEVLRRAEGLLARARTADEVVGSSAGSGLPAVSEVMGDRAGEGGGLPDVSRQEGVSDQETATQVPAPTLVGGVGGRGVREGAGDDVLAIDRVVDGRYRLMQPMASGGFSRVFMAERVSTHEPVVLKFFAPPDAADRRACDEHFRAEVRALGRLDHPGIAHLLDSGIYHDLYFLVMECVLGETLRARMRREPAVSLGCGLHILLQACDALGRAHERGVIHRDIKPENLMVEVEGDEHYRVRLVDFGLAMIELMEGEGVLPAAFAGTPRYMSPEQIRREPLTDASDLFSLGLVAYELLTGEHPFARETVEATRDAILVDDVYDPRELVPAIPAGAAEMVLRMLAKLPGDRPDSADEVGVAFG